MRSLLTVSEFALRGGEAERGLRRWVAETRAIHAGLELTGGMVLARNLIADLVEGEAGAVALALRRAREARHQVHLVVVDSLTVRTRTFAGWSLLYQGSSTYVAAPIAALLEVQDAYHSHRLRSMLKAFGDPAPRRPPAKTGAAARHETEAAGMPAPMAVPSARASPRRR
ncbi:hypothetical protein E2493_09040 [Sphingomonas parva]|uniref:BLUF domain-containing protein n=1 Tax=Sphingomonas parva TaxID=2555898 RepID=A0A4Y8ZUY2_9SPHN|nr:hypothetical protein [Sphingomonas parva]TFI58559.1 hypothetical protein E2493_09040 [Sphingomonas parva]